VSPYSRRVRLSPPRHQLTSRRAPKLPNFRERVKGLCAPTTADPSRRDRWGFESTRKFGHPTAGSGFHLAQNVDAANSADEKDSFQSNPIERPYVIIDRFVTPATMDAPGLDPPARSTVASSRKGRANLLLSNIGDFTLAALAL
jgi:hypothetical protein